MTSDVPWSRGRHRFLPELVPDGEDFQDKIPVAEGKWKIRFQFSFPDSSVRLPGGQTFQLNGMEAVLDGVTISPLSIQVDYTVKEELVWDNQSQENGRESEHDREQSYRFFESLPLSLNMADGSTVDLSSWAEALTRRQAEQYAGRAEFLRRSWTCPPWSPSRWLGSPCRSHRKLSGLSWKEEKSLRKTGFSFARRKYGGSLQEQ